MASLRDNTSVSYELIVVDNGSLPEAASRASELGDKAVLNGENLGFARGMNSGLAAAEGRYVAFINNDTVFPPNWAESLLEDFTAFDAPGIVAPAVTAAGNPVTVRSETGSKAIVLTPFGELPSGVVYVMEVETIRTLGGWNESYPIATAEDLDLCFTVWVNGLDFILDERVLVEHASQGTIRTMPERSRLWRENLSLFLDRWTSPESDPVRLPTCPSHEFQLNVRHARGAAMWLQRYIEARDLATQTPSIEPHLPSPEQDRGLLARLLGR